MATIGSTMTFFVKRQNPQLIVPAKPTPREEKPLSDVDDQEALRYQISFISFYAHNPLLEGEDPIEVIRNAISQALVYYYPFAGRIKEGPQGRFLVDCNGEGILFIEAEAYVTLEDLGDSIQPPCPYLKELLHDVPGSAGLVGCPLLLCQMTRLLCGGFVFAIRWSHNVADALGMFKFLNTVAEIARGKGEPSKTPVWQRELLNARNPPRVTFEHHEFDVVNSNGRSSNWLGGNNNNVVYKSFFFSFRAIKSIKMNLPRKFRTCSTFEVLAAFLWRSRTIAMCLDPDQIARVSYMVSAVGKEGLKLPDGYYGNAFVFPVARSKAGLLCTSPLEYALEIVKEIKERVNEEYIRSTIDLMVVKGRRQYRTVEDFVIADTSRLPFRLIDFGWGNAVYGGPAGAISGVSFFARFRNGRGEDGIVVHVSLPNEMMERFEKELAKTIGDSWEDQLSMGPMGITSRL